MNSGRQSARQILRPLLLFGSLATIATTVNMAGPVCLAPAFAQSSPSSPTVPLADWETAAGGKMEFEVASVKRNLTGYPPFGDPPHSNFPMDSGDAYSLNGGLFDATNWPLYSYIGFAYKLTPDALAQLQQQLPKWVAADHFDIQARAHGNPTKDQMRLMMQALLAERFKLTVHRQARTVQVYDLAIDKPGRLGSQLQQHSSDRPCVAIANPSSNDTSTAETNGVSPSIPCGTMSAHFDSGSMRVVGRALTMNQLAGYLKSMARLDRPVQDKTGMEGAYDFTIEWTPEGAISLNGVNVQLDENGPTFREALKQQLGLTLNSATGTVDYLTVDHVEEPSPN